MNRKSLLIAIVFLTTFCVATQAQDDEPKRGFDRNKLFFGGNFGLGFGGNSTLVNVSPQIGYRFNPYLAAGAGVTFLYSSYKYRYTNPQYKENYGVAGLNVFGRVYPIEYLFLQIQPEMNYNWGKFKFYDGRPDQKLDGKIVPSLLGGAGAAIPAGGGAFIIMVQYDLLQNDRTPYGNRAFYNFGYNFGF
ncbi:hypothetical protein [Paraflavitalea speifideaquila]|uniref:hypothetical protein n=1 Tax=Paraflavitalea speifideaquila TaxID=3076558 RepID=UPI0028EA485B|nr:hypothetical protein [Paraflavitalea speifideiaquila]